MKEDLKAQAEKVLEEVKPALILPLATKYNTDSTSERMQPGLVW